MSETTPAAAAEDAVLTAILTALPTLPAGDALKAARAALRALAGVGTAPRLFVAVGPYGDEAVWWGDPDGERSTLVLSRYEIPTRTRGHAPGADALWALLTAVLGAPDGQDTPPAALEGP